MGSASSKRIFYIDAIRAIAIVFVLLCHVSNEYPLVNTNLMATIPFLTHDIGVFGVPLFFMISGALLLGRNYPTITDFLKKRFLRIVYPFIFWMIIFTVLYFAIMNNNIAYLTDILFGQRFTWFIYALIGIYLFIPIINAFINKYGIKGAEYFLILWAVTLVFSTINFSYDWINLQLFSRYVGYVILGYYLSNKDFRLKDRTVMIIGLLMAVVFLGVNFYITIVQGKALFYLEIPVVLESAGLYLAIRYSNFINNVSYSQKLGKITFSISKYSYGMYFSHVIIIGILFKLFNFTAYTPLLIPIILVIVVILSWGVNFILSKIPFLAKFSGS